MKRCLPLQRWSQCLCKNRSHTHKAGVRYVQVIESLSLALMDFAERCALRWRRIERSSEQHTTDEGSRIFCRPKLSSNLAKQPPIGNNQRKCIQQHITYNKTKNRPSERERTKEEVRYVAKIVVRSMSRHNKQRFMRIEEGKVTTNTHDQRNI